MEEQKIQEEQPTWMKAELQQLNENKPEGNYPDALTLEEGKITEFDVNFEKEFEKWIDPQTGTVKKIIPVKHKGKDMVLWLSTRNPLYRQLMEAGMDGRRNFKIMRTGQAKQTRYTLLKE